MISFNMKKTPIGIYVHIPFCIQKCKYCDFLSAPGDSERIREYVSVLKKEIMSYRAIAESRAADTVYFGGGTPSVLEPELMGEIVDALKNTFDLKDLKEFTVEVNPGTVDLKKLKGYREIGADRLSVGVQSADDDELRLLGRIHSFAEAKDCFATAREAGFYNISADVISALPGQTLEKYEENLEKIIALKPVHISSYSLIIEPGTSFWTDYGDKGKKRGDLPDEDTDRRMYALTKKKLEEAGFHRYEISNYAAEGFESKHNSSYWTGKEYIGLGLGASSFVENVRYSNVRELGKYLINPEKHIIEEKLDKKALMSEFMILGLRMTAGISKKEFLSRFGTELDNEYGESLRRFEKLGAIRTSGDRISLTDYGMDVSNIIFEEFL